MTLYLIVLLLSFSLYAESSEMKIEAVLSHQSTSYENVQEIFLEENLNGGRILKLNNGTTWEVAPQDLPITEIWIFPFPLKLEKSNNAAYPYYIVNLRSKTKVLVRPLPIEKENRSDLLGPQSQQLKKSNQLQTEESLPPVPEPTPLDH